MVDIKSYDWSALDRYCLVYICNILRKLIVNKKLKDKDITKMFRKHFKDNDIPIKIKTKFSNTVPKNQIWVGALFDGDADKKMKKPIILDFFYAPNQDFVTLNYDAFNCLSYEIADTILHELIHMRQYRRRKYKNLPGYTSYAESSKQKQQQEYLGHNDEIDAYAFNIACILQDKYFDSKTKSRKYINEDLKNAEKNNTSYYMYLSTFDFNHNHKVIKKLKKRIVYYLPYAEIGKPYKTKDWLKR